MKNIFPLFFLFVVLIFFPPPKVFADSPQKIAAVATLNKASYVVGEPIYVTFGLKNITDEMIEFQSRLAFSYGDVKVSIMKPNQLPEDYKGVFGPSLYPYYSFELYPGQVERVSLMILYSEDSEVGLIFDKPGKAVLSITLNGTYEGRSVQFNFPPLPVEIVLPEGKDLQALKSIRDKSIFFDININRISPGNLQVFEKFIKEYPGAAYFPFFLYATACSYMMNIGDKEKDLNQAITLFKLYIARYPKNILTDDAVYKIAECYHELKDAKTAKKWFVKLYNEYLDSNRVNRYDPLMKEYIFLEKEEFKADSWMLYDPFVE
ncbi:tetratricopeptide repeat protein [Candidatus Sumerlaeota bacterium]|nr:tetratricopeptide repeat protein [Candidatus Sumerlaeota bacterium]